MQNENKEHVIHMWTAGEILNEKVILTKGWKEDKQKVTIL